MPAHRLVTLPDDISFQQAAAMMLQGMTARYLIKGCYNISAGEPMMGRIGDFHFSVSPFPRFSDSCGLDSIFGAKGNCEGCKECVEGSLNSAL